MSLQDYQIATDKQQTQHPLMLQVKLEEGPRLLKIFKVRMSRCLETSSTTQRAKIMGNIADPVVRLERNLNGHPLAGLLWERQFEEVLLELGWEKVPNWEWLFLHRQQQFLLSVYVDDI